jgi:hypothetical protein
MEYVCDAPPHTWFRIMTDAEAAQESKAMDHAVEKYFRQMQERAAASYVPPRSGLYVEQSIGRKDHIKRTMPLFLTLRDKEGKALVTAMLPPGGRSDSSFRPIVVGKSNGDPYPDYADAIEKLAAHYGLPLEPERCFPYRR